MDRGDHLASGFRLRVAYGGLDRGYTQWCNGILIVDGWEGLGKNGLTAATPSSKFYTLRA